MNSESVLRWITNPAVAATEKSGTTHAHALARRQVSDLEDELILLGAASESIPQDGSVAALLHQAKLCVVTDSLNVANQREQSLRQESLEQDAPACDETEWESVPLVLHECVTPGIDALKFAVDMNCDQHAKSYFNAMDSLTGQITRHGLCNAVELQHLRGVYGSHLNINGLDVNCQATSIDGKTVHLADYMLGKFLSGYTLQAPTNLHLTSPDEFSKFSPALLGELLRALHPTKGTHVVLNDSSITREWNGPAIFKSYRGTWLHADVTKLRDSGGYATLLVAAGIRPCEGMLRCYFTDAVVMITGEPSSYGKLVKRVLIIHRDSYDVVMRRYNGVHEFDRAATPELQDKLRLDWLHEDQVRWLKANRVRFEIFVLRVGDAYLLPAGCLHYFVNTEPSPLHSCLGFNVRVRRPQDIGEYED